MVSNVLNSRIHTPAAESLSIAGKSGSEEFPVLAEKNAISLFDALEMLAFDPEGAFNKTGSGELLNLKDEQWEMMAWLEAKTSVTLNFSEENGPVKPLAERMTCNGAPVSKEQFHKSMEALAELSEHNPVPEPTVEQAETPLFPALEEDMPEVKLPDLLKEHGKLQEFRRLGRLQEHLDVNMDEMKKVQTEMSERKWSPSEPSLKRAGDAIGELSKALAGLPPQSGHQKVGMMNAQLSLNGVVEALKKADAVLAGVAEHRKSGGVAQLAEGPEAVRRELQQALGKSSFMYLWQAVEVSEKDKPWSEQALLHKGLGNAYDEMKSDCEKVVKAQEKVRDAYLRDVRSEQNGLLEEELALTKLAVDTDGADGMSARIRDAARALATLCGGIGSELSEEAGNRKTASLQNMKEAAVELRNLSAALHSAAAIREVTDAAEKEKGGEPVRALAVKALETVMKDLSKARESLKQHLKPGRINLTEKALSRGSHSQLAQQLEKAAAAVKSVKKAMDQNRSLLKLEVEVEKDAVDVFLHVLKSDRAMKATGRQWDKVVDVASALGHLAVKGWRATQTGMAHGFNPAEHSDFHSQIRGVVSGPLGMMVNVQRAMEDLAGAAMAASEKKPQVKRQLNDDCRALTPDQRKETLQQYREEKLAELDKKRVAAEQQTEMLGLVMAMTESELEDMLATFTDDRHRKSIGVLRNKCRATVKQCREATGKMCREMEQLVNPGGRSGIPATALRGKQDYKNAQRAIQKCLQSSEAAMKSLSAELAEITHKAINLFSKDAKLAKHIAGVVHASKAQIPENADEAQRARLLALFDRMVDELGPAFKTDEDPEGKDFAARVRRELMLHDMEVNLVAETPERAAEHLQGWVQKMTKKSSGKVSSEFTKRMAQTLLGQTAKSLLGGMFHGTKILKFGYSVGKAVESYLSDTQKLESTGTVERPVPQYMLDAVEKRLMCSLMEQTVSLFAPSLLKTGVQIGFMVNKVRQEGFSETMKETVAKLPENMVIDGGFQGIIAAGTVEVRALQETAATEAVQAATRSEGNAGEADKPKVGKGRPAEAHRLAEPQVKSRVGRSAPPDREQAASDARAVQPPVNAASEVAEDGIPVDASQKTSVGNTDATEFTMTEEEYNDTQIGIDVRNSTKVRTFIEKDIQDVIDRHPDGHGKITSPYSWVDTVNYKTKPPTFDRKRVIDIYTGNGVTDDVKILWEGGTGKRDSTDTTEAFRRDLFGHKPYKSDKNKPFEIIRLTPDDVNNAERSYTRLHQAWTNHMTGMRNRKPELATLYRNAFKLGFTNALNSSENNHSETEKTAIRGYLNGDTSGVITLRYNGQPVQDVIALVVPGTSENETHILVMDYDGNFKRVKATRELGEIKDGDTRYAFKPDEETQQFISRRLVLGDREKASAQRTQKVIMDPSSHYDTKLADRYLTTQDREFKRVVADPKKEMLDITYKAIDDMAGHLSMALGMAGFPESTPMGVLVGALITTGKGIVKYVITPADETTRLRNIRNQTIRDVLSGGVADEITGKTMDNLPKGVNKTAKSGLVWYQKSTMMSGDAGKIFNKGLDKAYDWMGLAIEDTTRPDTLFSNAEQTSAPSEDALTSSSGVGADRSKTETLWTQTLADLNKGFDELRYTKLSKETLERLEKSGIDYKKILDKHGSPASIEKATVNGVTDYSQVVYDQHGVNELWGEASKSHKKWSQSERLERMIDKLGELESKVTGDQTIQIPYSLLKDFRDAGIDIDDYLSGNAVDDDNNPQTRYAQKSERARLNHTELKRLKFIAEAKKLDPSDINGALKLLDEIRWSLSGDEKTTIPDELQQILEKQGIKVKDYIRTHGDEGPARKAVSQKGLPQLDRHLLLSDRTLDKHQFSDLAVMARLKLLEKNVQAPKDEVESLINSGTPGRLTPATITSLRNNGINIDAIAHRYGTSSSKEAAMNATGELNVEKVDIDASGALLLRTKIEKKIRDYKISIMIERMKSLNKTPGVGYRLPHDITDFIKQGQATSDGELFLEHLRHKNLSDAQLKSLRWMLEAEVELSPESTYEELAAFVRKMESETAPGENVTLPPALIQYLRARGVSIDKYLQEKGNSEIAKENARIRGDENHLNKAEIDINKSHLKEIEDMVFAQKRRAETPDIMKRLNDSRMSIVGNGEVDLPEDIRKFVLASPEIDDNNKFLEELKWRTVTKAELDWLYWTLKAENELGTDSTSEQTTAFMREMESSMAGDEVRALPPRLINRLKSHGIDVDDHLKRFGDTGLAKNLAVLRGTENILDSRDIKLSKLGLIKLREMLAAKPGARLREMLTADPTTQLRGIRARKPAAKPEEKPAANPTTQPGEIPASKPVTQPKNDDMIPFMGMSGERRMW